MSARGKNLGTCAGATEVTWPPRAARTGFSPVCSRTCARRFEHFANLFAQPAKGQEIVKAHFLALSPARSPGLVSSLMVARNGASNPWPCARGPAAGLDQAHGL
jgi:hypothetical protein